MYVWRLEKVFATAQIDEFIQKAQDHKISSVWVKIADGDLLFANVREPWLREFTRLVTAAHQSQITVYGYHVPHCATVADSDREVQLISNLLSTLKLDGVVIDNEEGASYFRGGANEAKAYAQGLKKVLGPANKFMVMSSHDVVSAHPKAYAAIIAGFIDVNGPQVYYGQSATVKKRLDRAVQENSAFPVPFLPVGAMFIKEAGHDDGGCANDDECAQRATDFIALVSKLHEANAQKFPGYGFWNWEEAPAKAWDVLKNTPIFV